MIEKTAEQARQGQILPGYFVLRILIVSLVIASASLAKVRLVVS